MPSHIQLRKQLITNIQHQMDCVFSHNMRALKTLSPTLFEKFKNYKPTKYRLDLSSDDYIDIVDISTRKSIYECDPAQISAQQYDSFKNSPNRIVCDLTRSYVLNHSYFSPQMLNRILDVCQSQNINRTFNINDPIGTLIITGVGLGHHISELYDNHQIENLVIFEPEPDFFHASLHTFNWEELINSYKNQNKTIQLFVDNTPDEVISAIKGLNQQIPLFQMTKIFWIQHIKNSITDQFIEQLKESHHHLVVNGGFFDDEHIGLSHTLVNFSQHQRLLNPSLKSTELPAIIVGNGPSLDELVPFLQENSENAAIFSCGTTLSVLSKIGVTPDFHVEMERTAYNEQWIAKAASDKFRRHVTLLALNTCPPQVTKQFGDCILAKKYNDIGESVINDLSNNLNPPALLHCNPTVSNAAASFAAAMGFKTIYLVGVDLGMPIDSNQHHSRLSLYEEIGKINKKAYRHLNNHKGQPRVKGNFSSQVRTTPQLNSSRYNLEKTLYLNPTITCFNLNDGALISGAIPTPKQGVSLKKIKNKKELIAVIKDRNSFTPKLVESPISYANDLLSDTILNWQKMSLPKINNFESLDEINGFFKRYWINILRDRIENPIHYHLFQGSTNAAFAMIYSYMAETNDPSQRNYLYTHARHVFNNFFLKNAYQKLIETPVRCDDSIDTNLTMLD